MRKIICLPLCLLLILIAKSGFCGAGSGGYRLEVPDAGPMGMGSAFVAQADRPSAVYYNPAGLIQLKDSRFYTSFGDAIIQPFTNYKSTTGNKSQMREQIFNIPHGYFVSDFGVEKMAFGLGVTSSWGLGTYWRGDSFSRYVATRSELTMQNTYLTAAYELNENLSVGVGADLTKAKADKSKKLIQTSGTTADGDFRLVGKDQAWGYRVSALYKLNPRHQFGLLYRSPTKLKYRGKVFLNNLTDAATYIPLFGTDYETAVTSVSTLPQSFVFGYCFKPDDKWRFEADLEWMDWSSVKEEKLEYPDLAAGAAQRAVLDAGNPASRDWNSVFSFALGTEYKVNDKLKLRGGFFFHKTPVPEANFDTALPDASVNSITLGTGYNINKNWSFDFAYGAMFYNSRKINNTIGSGSGANINGKYKQFTNLYFVTFTYKL